ncbi:MAG: hypothetical protein ACI9OI_001595, partial [Chitinophagales bacterium]
KLLEGQADLVRFQGRQLQSGYENKVEIFSLGAVALALLSPLVCPQFIIKIELTQ